MLPESGEQYSSREANGMFATFTVGSNPRPGVQSGQGSVRAFQWWNVALAHIGEPALSGWAIEKTREPAFDP